MSYSRCFICQCDNYSGNEIKIVLKRIRIDKEKQTKESREWEGFICENCLQEHFLYLEREVM